MRGDGRNRAAEAVLGALRESREFVSGLVLNLALVVGVVVFGWNLAEIAVVYLVEVAVVNLLFLSVGLFTPQPVDGSDGGSRDGEPTPFQPIGSVPPVYRRNVRFVGGKALPATVPGGVVLWSVVSEYDLASALSPSIGLAIAGVVLFQLTRVRRHFVADGAYREKSPADAVDFAFAPAVELFLMIVYVVVPVTLLLAGVAFALDTDLNARPLLFLYLVPMGFVRAWIGSLDPGTDDLEIGLR